MLIWSTMGDWNILPQLSAVKAPVLVIHGEADPLVPVQCGVATAAAIPGAQLLPIPDMGHALPRRHWPSIVNAIAAHTAAAH